MAAVTAAGFAVASLNPYALTAGPLLGALPHGSAAHADCAGMQMEHHMEHHKGDTDHHSGHSCCCMGACCCTAIVSVPPGRLTVLLVVPVVIARAIISTEPVRPATAPDYRLPPPLGPPSLRV